MRTPHTIISVVSLALGGALLVGTPAPASSWPAIVSLAGGHQPGHVVDVKVKCGQVLGQMVCDNNGAKKSGANKTQTKNQTIKHACKPGQKVLEKANAQGKFCENIDTTSTAPGTEPKPAGTDAGTEVSEKAPVPKNPLGDRFNCAAPMQEGGTKTYLMFASSLSEAESKFIQDAKERNTPLAGPVNCTLQ